MKKDTVCKLNAFLCAVLFLVVYGYIFYTLGDENKQGMEDALSGMIPMLIFHAVLAVVSVWQVFNSYRTKKGLIATAVFSVAYSVILLFVGLFLWLFRNGELNHWMFYVETIVPLPIGGLYLYAALKKEKN